MEAPRSSRRSPAIRHHEGCGGEAMMTPGARLQGGCALLTMARGTWVDRT
jgi:hypothetical protein